jgi:hypothetical protein
MMAGRKSFLLRIDGRLYEALRQWADQEMRSVNGQIEYLLRTAVLARRPVFDKKPEPREPAAEEEADEEC